MKKIKRTKHYESTEGRYSFANSEFLCDLKKFFDFFCMKDFSLYSGFKPLLLAVVDF